ncbi:hypothetical protein [Actinomadura sp. 9N407]|uniref:hypothetical protein n=1 Tax=Actinomadura sp. 9N407 TaxID=3375154 RepID=UPI0037A36FAC
MGGRHHGALPLLVLLIGGVIMATLLAAQGRLGLRPPAGENATLAELSPRYLPPLTDRAVTGLLALAMIGWFGFNIGLGGGAVAALTGMPDGAGVLLLTLPIVAVLLKGGGNWNAVALVTTLTAIALIAVVAVRLAPSAPPVTLAPDGPPLVLIADLAGYIGYVSVFAVRAPDFTVGLRGRRDLWWCVGLLVVPALAASIVGAGLAASSGSTDVVAVLAGPDGLPVANLFVAAAVIAPTLAAVHSGVFAVRRFAPRLPPAYAVLAIAVPGAVLAAMRVDRLLLDWLTLLAATLPALIPPMTAEALRRRRTRALAAVGVRTSSAPEDGPTPTEPPAAPGRHVPTGRHVSSWLWAPGAALALTLTLAGFAAAAPVGLVVSALATVAHSFLAKRRGIRS